MAFDLISTVSHVLVVDDITYEPGHHMRLKAIGEATNMAIEKGLLICHPVSLPEEYGASWLENPSGPALLLTKEAIEQAGGLVAEPDDHSATVSEDSVILGWAYSNAFALVSATRDADGAITTATIQWPSGATGVYTTDTKDATNKFLANAWHATYVDGATTKTVTQALMTRDAQGRILTQPPITIA